MFSVAFVSEEQLVLSLKPEDDSPFSLILGTVHFFEKDSAHLVLCPFKNIPWPVSNRKTSSRIISQPNYFCFQNFLTSFYSILLKKKSCTIKNWNGIKKKSG